MKLKEEEKKRGRGGRDVFAFALAVPFEIGGGVLVKGGK